jgi:hypothetical protein
MKEKELRELVKNKNFINSQNYVLWKKIVNRIKSSMNISKNWWNMIWYDSNKKIQEINIWRLKKENNKLKFFFVIFFILWLFPWFFSYFETGDNESLKWILFWLFFMLIFIPPWFISFWKKERFNFYKNYQKIIIYEK